MQRNGFFENSVLNDSIFDMIFDLRKLRKKYFSIKLRYNPQKRNSLI